MTETPADPATVGFKNILLRGRRPAAAAVEFYAELLADVVNESGLPTDAAKDAAYRAMLDEMGFVHHGSFMGAEKCAIGSDAHGWAGFVTDGKRLVRSDDLFGTAALAGEWCQSAIDRFAGRQ